jgi:hypothetical protein
VRDRSRIVPKMARSVQRVAHRLRARAPLYSPKCLEVWSSRKSSAEESARVLGGTGRARGRGRPSAVGAPATSSSARPTAYGDSPLPGPARIPSSRLRGPHAPSGGTTTRRGGVPCHQRLWDHLSSVWPKESLRALPTPNEGISNAAPRS